MQNDFPGFLEINHFRISAEKYTHNFFFLAVPVACGSFHVRDQTHATAVTSATAVPRLYPYPAKPPGTATCSFFKSTHQTGSGFCNTMHTHNDAVTFAF